MRKITEEADVGRDASNEGPGVRAKVGDDGPTGWPTAFLWVGLAMLIALSVGEPSVFEALASQIACPSVE